MDIKTVNSVRKTALAIRDKEGKNKPPTALEQKTYKRLLAAHISIVETIEKSIWKGIETAFIHDPLATDTIIVNPHKDANLQGYHFLTIMHGFYDEKKESHKRSVHHTAGIRYDPITELKNKLEQSGIINIENISNKKKSPSLVLKISFVFLDLDEEK